MSLVDVEITSADSMIVLQRGDGTATISLPRSAVEKALRTASANRTQACGCSTDNTNPEMPVVTICARHLADEPHLARSAGSSEPINLGRSH